MALKDPRELAQVLTLTNPQAAITGGEPTIQAKPQRFTKRPQLGDYGLKYNEGPFKAYKDAFYYSEPDDVDVELTRLKGEIAKPENQRHLDYYNTRINALSDPNIQKYLRDSKAFNSQFKKDADEYYPTAKDVVIRKLLGDGDFYRTRKYGDNNTIEDLDDIFDSINADFGKKYGYSDAKYQGDLFSPLRFKNHSMYSPLEDSEDIDGGYREKYNKGGYIAELLRSGELSLDDLKRYILGK